MGNSAMVPKPIVVPFPINTAKFDVLWPPTIEESLDLPKVLDLLKVYVHGHTMERWNDEMERDAIKVLHECTHASTVSRKDMLLVLSEWERFELSKVC
jgi:hypothetical protein